VVGGRALYFRRFVPESLDVEKERGPSEGKGGPIVYRRRKFSRLETGAALRLCNIAFSPLDLDIKKIRPGEKRRGRDGRTFWSSIILK